MDEEAVSSNLAWLVGVTLVGYVGFMYALSFAIQRRIHEAADFIVAGRRLPFSLAWATLLATWFGAGTMLTAADEVRDGGLRRAALDPWGAGFCLLLAGLFFARPLWEMGLLTLSDFYRRKFGAAAELGSVVIMVPSYFGWVAAQLVALAGLLHFYFGLDLVTGILLVAAVAMGYTLLGGMWSVTITDAAQISLVLVGLVVLTLTVLAELGQGHWGAGLARLEAETPGDMLQLVPTESLRDVVGWLGVFAVGALGNLPGQDLMQRVFAARSARTAQLACLTAGGVYLLFGTLPLLLGLSARLLVPDDLKRSILPALAGAFLSPPLAVIFTLALASAVLSTIDSAILSPASVLSQNLLAKFNRGRISPLTLNRLAVVLVTAASVGMALAGQDAYTLLEDAYELPLVGLLVPLVIGLYAGPQREGPAVVAMLVGSGLWMVHFVAGWDEFGQPWTAGSRLHLPVALTAAAVSLVAYGLAAWLWPRSTAGPIS